MHPHARSAIYSSLQEVCFLPLSLSQMEALHSFLSEELLHSGIRLPVQYTVHNEVLLHTVLHRFPPELGMLLLWLYHRYHRLQYPAAFQEAESDLSVRYQVLNFCDILVHSVYGCLHYSTQSELAVRRILSCRFQLLPEVLPVPQQTVHRQRLSEVVCVPSLLKSSQKSIP